MNADVPDGLIRRLLGPDGPEVSCEQCFELLDRYVELELGEARRRRRDPRHARAPARVPGLRGGPREPPALVAAETK